MSRSRWWFQVLFIFTPKIGEDWDSPLTNIFLMGWFNHQPGTISNSEGMKLPKTPMKPNYTPEDQPLNNLQPSPVSKGKSSEPSTSMSSMDSSRNNFPGCFWLFEICRQYTQMTYVWLEPPQKLDHLDQLKFYAITAVNQKILSVWGYPLVN